MKFSSLGLYWLSNSKKGQRQKKGVSKGKRQQY